jgi:hypothetical protein
MNEFVSITAVSDRSVSTLIEPIGYILPLRTIKRIIFVFIILNEDH